MYKTGEKSHLRTHKQSIHEAVTYSCKECEYKAGQKSHIRRHEQSKH